MTSDWQRLIDGQMAAREDRAARRSMAVNYPNGLHALVMDAARKRDMTMTAYQRRASLAFAEWDLGFDWFDAMRDEPPVGRFMHHQARIDVEGTGFGAWQIVDLREHSEDVNE